MDGHEARRDIDRWLMSAPNHTLERLAESMGLTFNELADRICGYREWTEEQLEAIANLNMEE